MDDLLERAGAALIERAPAGPSSGQLRRRLAVRRRRRFALVVCLAALVTVNGLVLIATRSPTAVVPAGDGTDGGSPSPGPTPTVDPSSTEPTTTPATVLDDGGVVLSDASTSSASRPGRAPIARDDLVVLVRGERTVVPVLSNDSDPDGDRLVLVSVGAVEVPRGVVAIISGDAVTLELESQVVGTATFGYTVRDPDGSTASATLTVIVREAPDVP